MTVKELFEKLKASRGFVIFVSYAEERPDESIGLQHQMIRQQYATEDLDSSFVHFKEMLVKDMSDSGLTIIKSAERIANEHLPEGNDKPAPESTDR